MHPVTTEFACLECCRDFSVASDGSEVVFCPFCGDDLAAQADELEE